MSRGRASSLDAPALPLPALVSQAAVRAESMGLLRDGGGGPVARVAEDVTGALREVARAAGEAGIARALPLPGDAGDVAAWTRAATGLLDALDASPLPAREWAHLERVLGTELLATLVDVSPSSLRRYAGGTRETPDAVAARLHCVALIVGDIAGSYNEIGIRRWFARPRAQLDGAAPMALLVGDWDPDDEGPRRVRALAAALLGMPST